MMRGEEDQQHRLLYELCALVFSILRSPPLPAPGSRRLPPPPRRALSRPPPLTAARRPRVSPAGIASLLLGMSLALMLCGSVTFVIGFMLIPWVIGLVLVLYFVGIVSSLSVLGRWILGPGPASLQRSPRKELAGKQCISTRQTTEELCVWQ